MCQVIFYRPQSSALSLSNYQHVLEIGYNGLLYNVNC